MSNTSTMLWLSYTFAANYHAAVARMIKVYASLGFGPSRDELRQLGEATIDAQVAHHRAVEHDAHEEDE